MKILLISVFFTSILFLIIDILWLSFSVKSFYRPNLGNLLLEKPIFWAAVLFYIIYVFGLAVVVIRPAMYNYSVLETFYVGVVFGLVAYGTYNLTNMATIKGWSINVVFVDMIWGGLLTGTSSTLGIFIAKKIFN